MTLYTQSAPSRELCERMAQIGICQDEPELWWVFNDDDRWCVVQFNPVHRIGRCIAPTLPRMMEALGNYCSLCRDGDIDWQVWTRAKDEIWDCIGVDKHLPNAVAKALIAIEEGKYGNTKH